MKPGTRKTTGGFYLPSLVTVFLVILFVALLFGTRILQKAAPAKISHSERYHELVNRENLSDAEKSELKLESCRFRRKQLVFLRSTSFANYERDKTDYLQDCEDVLPLKATTQ